MGKTKNDKKKIDPISHSPASILSNAKASRKAYDATWALATRAPMFCKITKKTTSDGKKKLFYRTARLVGSQAYMIAASGAAANAAAVMKAECALLREDVEEESAKAPWMPSISKGAKMVLEQWLCALAQEATKKAHAVREGCGSEKHEVKRLNRTHMQMGWDSVFDNVFSKTAIMPPTVFVSHLLPKKKVSKSSKAGEQADNSKSSKAGEQPDISDAPQEEDEVYEEEEAATGEDES